MSRLNIQSPEVPILSPVKSEGNLNKTILSGLFSKQFLGCLKDELSARTRESKPVDEAYRRALAQIKVYKKELEAMRIKIEELTRLNQALASKLQLYESADHQAEDAESQEPSVIVCPPQFAKHLELSQPSELGGVREGGVREEEVAELRERIEKLELSRSIKDQRLNELVEKEVRFDSEIKLLKIKNGELEDEVKSLRETIILQTSEKALLDTVHSQQHQPDIAISYHFSPDSPPKPPRPTHLFPAAEGSLTASFTNNVTIPAELTLSKACLRRDEAQREAAEFNEIDYILGEELPYLKVSGELIHSQQEPCKPAAVSNLNESLVLININNA